MLASICYSRLLLLSCRLSPENSNKKPANQGNSRSQQCQPTHVYTAANLATLAAKNGIDGEGGSSNLMWLLDFKLDFFNEGGNSGTLTPQQQNQLIQQQSQLQQQQIQLNALNIEQAQCFNQGK